ncbi:hypothetical protein RHGRI_029547 [Rhododendron griersonianum]|uniref:Uncharacterized protein n=1 Tax=Rhododendron griersonianum TaxID=479676 RepID=A0AAV6INH1_9ERIC|nr:hypothetical protein RHGRI_029547 [Rhododendron griersonianum]
MFPYLLSIAVVPLYFFLHQSTFSLAINSPNLYSQQLDHVVLNCGSSSNSISVDTRQWISDTGSKYINSLHGSKRKLISSKATDKPLPSASYRGGFKRSKAFFTIKAGPCTLLSNFSASLTVDTLGVQYLVKEYCVHVEEDQSL